MQALLSDCQILDDTKGDSCHINAQDMLYGDLTLSVFAY